MPAAVLAGVTVFVLFKPDATPPSATPSASPRVMATGPVTVDTPKLDERAATVCRALISQLPDQVRDLPRRAVAGGFEQNAAYGDPPLTIACGGKPDEVADTDFVYPLDKVCWHASQSPAGNVLTTVDREVPVRVTVPRELTDQPAQWVIALSDTVVATVPSAKSGIPTGCTR